MNDDWDVGASLLVGYSGIGASLPMRAGSLGLGFLGEAQYELCRANPSAAYCQHKLNMFNNLAMLDVETESSLNVGFNVGALWRVTEWATMGAVYQSAISTHNEGNATWRNDPDLLKFLGQLQPALESALGVGTTEVFNTKTEVNLKLPDHFAIGTSIKLLPKLKVNLDYKYTGWSAWKDLRVDVSEPIDEWKVVALFQPELATATSMSFPLKLKDTWNYAAGFEYEYSKEMVLRFGYEDRPTSVPSGGNGLLPVGDGFLLGAGVGLKLKNGAVLDLSVSTLRAKLHMPPGSSNLANSKNPYELLYNPYPGQDIKATTQATFFELSYQAPF